MTQIMTLDAKPEPIAIDPAKTAVIVVDMQNDFGSKGGMFDRAGIDISGIQRAVPPTARVLAAVRRLGIKIVYLKMGYRSDLSDLGAPGTKNQLLREQRLGVGQTMKAPDGKEYRVLIRDTWGTDIVDELKPQPEDIVIYKHRYSGFYQTDLDLVLKKAGIRHLVVTGCTTSICVESTLRDAFFRDYLCVLPDKLYERGDCPGCLAEQPRSDRMFDGAHVRVGLNLRAVAQCYRCYRSLTSCRAVADLPERQPRSARRPGAVRHDTRAPSGHR